MTNHNDIFHFVHYTSLFATLNCYCLVWNEPEIKFAFCRWNNCCRHQTDPFVCCGRIYSDTTDSWSLRNEWKSGRHAFWVSSWCGLSTSRSEISSKYGVCLEEEEEEEEGHFCVLQFSGAAQRALQQKYTIHLKTMQYTLSIKFYISLFCQGSLV